jgi:cytoskeletal protein RodZ
MTENLSENSSKNAASQNFYDDSSSKLEEHSIGKTLRHKREQMKLEIRDVGHRLKVKTSDLEALENDDLLSVTKHLYIPGLVGSYARILKLDQKLMEQKVKKLPIRSNTDNKDHRLINIGEESDLTPPKDLLINAFMVAILMMLVLLSIYHSYNNRDDLITDKQLISELEKS